MRTVGRNASDAELLDAVREWVGLLASGNYAAAANFLYPLESPHTEEWTPERLETFIAGYGWHEPLLDGRRMQVTPIETAGGDLTPRHEVTRGDGRPPSVEFDLPLNGEWSDLTAI